MKSHFNFVQHETVAQWHAWRDTKVGASDINYIMSTVKKFKGYKGRAELLHEKKTGQKKEGPAFIFDKGHKFEEKMRPKSEMLFDLNLPPACIVPNGFPWDEYLSASLDGFDVDKNIIWECKLVGRQVFNEIKESKKPPHKYAYQIQQQLLITKAKYCILCFGTSEEEYDHIKVYPDDEMQREIVAEGKLFWDEWHAEAKPPEGFYDVIVKIAEVNNAIKILKNDLEKEKKKLQKWDFKNIVEHGDYKYSRSASIRTTFNKDKALEFLSEEKAKKCYKETKSVSYKVTKVRKKEVEASI